jgi:hypothetical protein
MTPKPASQAYSSANPAVVVANDSTPNTAIGVNRGGNMSVEVGVYPAGDPTCLYDGHRHPFFSSRGQGVARTSREGDRDDRTASTVRSITLRNGACPYLGNGPADRHLHVLDATKQSDRNRRAAEPNQPPSTGGGPHRTATTNTHWHVRTRPNGTTGLLVLFAWRT